MLIGHGSGQLLQRQPPLPRDPMKPQISVLQTVFFFEMLQGTARHFFRFRQGLASRLSAASFGQLTYYTPSRDCQLDFPGPTLSEVQYRRDTSSSPEGTQIGITPRITNGPQTSFRKKDSIRYTYRYSIRGSELHPLQRCIGRIPGMYLPARACSRSRCFISLHHLATWKHPRVRNPVSVRTVLFMPSMFAHLHGARCSCQPASFFISFSLQLRYSNPTQPNPAYSLSAFSMSDPCQ
jgi:hypothetical protein